MPLLRPALVAVLLLALAACAPAQRSSAPAKRTPAASRAPANPQTAAALAKARNAIAEAKRAQPGWNDADALLAQAQQAANRGNQAQAQSLALEATARANATLDVHYMALAQIELQKSQVYTGLSDAQLADQRSAELALARGEGRRAFELLSKLNQRLAEATQRYVVAAGDSLWVIAGRDAVYGNPWLWPLIWQANLKTIPNPHRLLAGQKLKIKPNPTIEEVVQAVTFARENAGRRIDIGEVREER